MDPRLGRALVASALVIALPPSSPAFAGEPRLPFPQHVAYAAGALRPSHRTQAQQDADVLAAYQSWKSRYLVQAGTKPDGHPRYRVKLGTAAGAKTVSEGQGYGMLVAVHMAGADPNAQAIFDGLWEFCLDHPSSIDARLMDWSVEANEVPDAEGNDSAFDGDADIALALLLAGRQWGNGGRFDYRAEAARVLAGILESTIGPGSRLPLLGDWVDPDGSPHYQWTPRSSDFMPGHFRALAAATGDAAWTAAVAAVQQAVGVLQTEVSPATGLLPDFVAPVSAIDHRPRPAPPGFLEGPNDGAYYYNAGRDPWRLATDALLSGDATSRAQAAKLAQWVRGSTGGDPLDIAGGYRLDGTPIGAFFSSFFAAPFGVAANFFSLLGVRPALGRFFLPEEDSVPGRDRVLALAAICVAAAFLFGWLPARRPIRLGLGETLRQQSGAIAGRAPLGRWLVGAQAAVAVALVAIGAMVVASSRELAAGIAFEPSRVALLRLRPRLLGYPPEKAQELLRRVLRRLAETPGVESASMVGTGSVLLGLETEVALPAWTDGGRAPTSTRPTGRTPRRWTPASACG